MPGLQETVPTAMISTRVSAAARAQLPRHATTLLGRICARAMLDTKATARRVQMWMNACHHSYHVRQMLHATTLPARSSVHVN